MHYLKVHIHIKLHMSSVRQFRGKCYTWEPCFSESFANAVTAPPPPGRFSPQTVTETWCFLGGGGRVTNQTNTSLPAQSRHSHGFGADFFIEAAPRPHRISNAGSCTGAHATSGAPILKCSHFLNGLEARDVNATSSSSEPVCRAVPTFCDPGWTILQARAGQCLSQADC